MDYSPTGSSVHGISQAKILEWGAISFSTYLVFNLREEWFINVVSHPNKGNAIGVESEEAWSVKSGKSVWNIDPGLFFEGADKSVYILRPPEKKYVYYTKCVYFI